MGIFDSKEKREATKSKKEYDECYQERRRTLLSFRSSAIREISSKYTDAKFLLNRLDDRFMVLVRSAGILFVGKFADSYYPRLEYIDVSDSAAARSEAVARYRREVSRSLGNISPDNLPRFREVSKWMSESTTNSFKDNGYALTGSAELKYLIGGAVFMDGNRIAISSIWEPKQLGYFAEHIIRGVSMTTGRGPETQYLGFVTADSNPIGEGGIMSYEISLSSFIKPRSGELPDGVQNIIDFLFDLEQYFGPYSPVADKDKLEYTSKSDAEYLEKYSRDEDQSIESRSLL